MRAVDLVRQGNFEEAARSLSQSRSQTADPLAAEELLDIIGRIRIAYPLDEQAMLAKLRSSIPDVRRDDLEKWRTANQIQFRVIDGGVRYFAREPANLFRFCPEAIARRIKVAPRQALGWTLESHLRQVIAEAGSASSPLVAPVRHRVKYRLTVKPQALSNRAMVSVWLPFPQEHSRQRDVKLLSTSQSDFTLAPIDAPQRTLYFQHRVEDPTKPLVFEEAFEFTSRAYYPALDDAEAKPLPTDFPQTDLLERPPHIRFSPALRKTAERIVGGEKNPLTAVRKIFRFVTGSIAYCAEEEYSTIPAISEKALATRRGDCGVQALLFITLSRAAGIPARWQSGWQTKPGAEDMHDWAEFYVAPWGWLPADPTCGAEQKDHPDPALRDFYLGHQDSYRLIVNTDYGAPLVPPKHSLRSEPLDFQRGEVEVNEKNIYFPGWDYDFTVEYL